MQLSKTKLKELSAFRQAKFRDSERVFIVEGEKLVEELFKSSFKPILICGISGFWENHTLNRKDIEIYEVSEKEMERLSVLSTPSPVWCLVECPSQPSAEFSYDDLVLVLDNLKDPGNMGSIIRTADWFGIKHLVCSKECVSIYNPKVVQSSMGSLFRVTIHEVDLPEFLKQKPADIPCYGAVLDGKNVYQETVISKAILVIGSESHGISQEILPFLTHKLLIPKYPAENPIDSLNAATATAILCAEIRRR